MNQEVTHQVAARDEKWVPTNERVKISTTNKILDICPRVQGVDFTEVLDETTLTFLLDLGYKGPLYKHPIMYVDHMHQPWGTLASFINKCLSDKTASNDRLRKSRIDIKIAGTPEATIDASEELDSKPARKCSASRRVVKKKVSISTDENIIPEPEFSLELGKSISLTKAIEEEATRQVHATHAKIVTESVPEPARRRPSGIAFRDISSVTKKLSLDPSQKLKGVQTLTPEEQLDAGTMQALKERVPDESTVVPATSSEETKKSEYTEEDDDDDEKIEWVNNDEEKEKNDDDDDKSIDLETIDDEETDDEFVHSEENVQDDDEETDDELVHANEQVNDNKDEEMTNAEDADTGNGDEEIFDTIKVDAEKTEEVKDDIKKAELPPTSSNLYVSLGFGDQFLKLSSDTYLISTVKDTTDAEIDSLLDI
ncbi:hypothetical protein Tco_1374643 [Tanacetum coccineum]